MTEWISVDEKMPYIGVTVEVKRENGFVSDGRFMGGFWTFGPEISIENIRSEITHWRPKPGGTK